jgi:hypothetical protein
MQIDEFTCVQKEKTACAYDMQKANSINSSLSM